MAENEPEKVLTKDELLAEMKTAMDTGDFKAVSKISSKIAKAQAVDEKAEKEAKQAVVAGVTEQVKTKLDGVIAKVVKDLDEDVLEAMDGVWYVNDFAESLTSCRLVKGAARKGGGGGGGKKFSITTKDLLEAHGAEQMGDSGQTFQEAYDADTNGNARYKVRMKLLKAHGLS